jgi:hypothetical protein
VSCNVGTVKLHQLPNIAGKQVLHSSVASEYRVVHVGKSRALGNCVSFAQISQPCLRLGYNNIWDFLGWAGNWWVLVENVIGVRGSRGVIFGWRSEAGIRAWDGNRFPPTARTDDTWSGNSLFSVYGSWISESVTRSSITVPGGSSGSEYVCTSRFGQARFHNCVFTCVRFKFRHFRGFPGTRFQFAVSNP